MSFPSRSLRRLAAVFGLVEHARALELRVATASVSEVEQAAVRLAGLRRRHDDAGLAALQNADTGEWALVRAATDAVETRRHRLDALLMERKDFRDKALVSYHASRMESEQIENEVERARIKAEERSRRRIQRDTDDHHLSRKEWIRQEERRRGLRQLE